MSITQYVVVKAFLFCLNHLFLGTMDKLNILYIEKKNIYALLFGAQLATHRIRLLKKICSVPKLRSYWWKNAWWKNVFLCKKRNMNNFIYILYFCYYNVPPSNCFLSVNKKFTLLMPTLKFDIIPRIIL